MSDVPGRLGRREQDPRRPGTSRKTLHQQDCQYVLKLPPSSCSAKTKTERAGQGGGDDLEDTRDTSRLEPFSG